MIRILIISALSFALVPQLAAASTYGAIAYSIQNDKYGRSWDYGSRQEAEAAAINFCESAGGRNCEVVVWLQDGCGALAGSETSRNVNQLGVSWGFGSEAASHARALTECEARDGPGTCRIIASVCSNGN